MGTFHQNKHALHGITVVVETAGGETFVGRCDDITEEQVILRDVDVHRPEEGGPTKAEYLSRAARFGVWKKHDRLVLPRQKVEAIARLGEF
ncbi:MAG: hypothetical protein AAF604_08605 [Acidobacteriota bacterium]